ncbi:MAG: aldehyde dehydrogenase family protein, partial [Actinomyces sp.]
DCRDDMSFVTEEVFGPLMAVLAFEDEGEVVARANATPYGLAAGVFTRDFDRAHRVADALEAGVVWINDYNVLPPSLPFGGHKQSGLGHENGVATIDHYTRRRSIYARVDPGPRPGDR